MEIVIEQEKYIRILQNRYIFLGLWSLILSNLYLERK